MSDLSLVLAGARGWLNKEVSKEIVKSAYKDQIIEKNEISDEERSFYYGLSSIFVYPSFFEGFGFPPLEAMACGTPVVASRNSSLSEVVGKGGVLVDPYNIEELAQVIAEILNKDALSSKLKDLGFAKSLEFNWKITAEETLACLLK